MEEKRPKKLLDQACNAIRTEQAYVGWIKRYILFPRAYVPRGHASMVPTLRVGTSKLGALPSKTSFLRVLCCDIMGLAADSDKHARDVSETDA